MRVHRDIVQMILGTDDKTMSVIETVDGLQSIADLVVTLARKPGALKKMMQFKVLLIWLTYLRS